jgi:hypothetical protein
MTRCHVEQTFRYCNFHVPLADMVKSTIVVRASDALPLAASVDDEQVSSAVIYGLLSLQCAYVSYTCRRPSMPSRSTSNKQSYSSDA